MRNDSAEIDDVLVLNASRACPTYTGLLKSLVDRGIVVRCALD
ncbi:hypothetical protein L810_2566 [Burkholderia sp. AU4i]|nr:hypothetical protein L810_2566 [Burkholderia sp. AU4i]